MQVRVPAAGRRQSTPIPLLGGSIWARLSVAPWWVRRLREAAAAAAVALTVIAAAMFPTVVAMFSRCRSRNV
jgi:hypothetical protein